MWQIFEIINPFGITQRGFTHYKILEPFILTGMVFLVLASSDIAIDP